MNNLRCPRAARYGGGVSDLQPVTHESNTTPARPGDGSTDLERFETSVRGMLTQVGLPVPELFVPVPERQTLVAALPG